MKVSIIASDLSGSGVGRWGGAVRPFLLAQALKQLNCDVELVGFCGENDLPSLSNLGISIIPVVREPYYPQFLRSAQQLLKQISGDLIYAYKPKPTSLGLSLIKKLQSCRPVIADIDDWELSWHGGDRFQYQPGFKQFARDILKPQGALREPDHPLYLKWIEGFVSKADAVTTHTQFLQQRFGGFYIPNGKDTNLFDPSLYDPQSSRERYGLEGYRTLMFPGAPRPYKGIEDILMALDLLNQPDLRLVIVGGSPYDDYDQQLMQTWGHRIIKMPKYPASAMPDIVAAADVIVVPQRDTPAAQAQFPLKLTDGMAMAKPILATRVGDIPTILGDTGYLVDANSPEQLAEKINWIFEHLDEANHKGLQARQRCVQHYSITAMADILDDLIHVLV